MKPTAKEIFNANQVLDMNNVMGLVGKTLAITNPEYSSNRPSVRVFKLLGIESGYEAAARRKSSQYESIQEMWIKENNQRAIESEKKRTVLIYEGDTPYATFERDYFHGSDSDRPIYYITLD